MLFLVLVSKKCQVLLVEYTTLSALLMPPLDAFSYVLVYLSTINVLFYCKIIEEITPNALRSSLGILCDLYPFIVNLG
jgi:hypothetical protein